MIFASDLTWIILLPVIGALALYAFPARIARWIALVTAALVFTLSLFIFFRVLSTPTGLGSLTNLADEVRAPWINFSVGSIPFKVE